MYCVFCAGTLPGTKKRLPNVIGSLLRIGRCAIRYPHLEYPQDMQVRHPFWYAMFSCPH